MGVGGARRSTLSFVFFCFTLPSRMHSFVPWVGKMTLDNRGRESKERAGLALDACRKVLHGCAWSAGAMH